MAEADGKSTVRSRGRKPESRKSVSLKAEALQTGSPILGQPSLGQTHIIQPGAARWNIGGTLPSKRKSGRKGGRPKIIKDSLVEAARVALAGELPKKPRWREHKQLARKFVIDFLNTNDPHGAPGGAEWSERQAKTIERDIVDPVLAT